MKRLLLIGLLLSIFASLFSQEGLLNDTLKIKTVSVVAVADPVLSGVIRIDSLAIRENYSGDLAGLLEYRSPVFIKTAAPGSLATVSMRGMLASHTQVNWNGIRLNSPMLGQVDFSLVPSFFADQIQVLSGPASVRSGAGGFGGQIDIESFPVWNRGFFTEAELLAGSFGRYGLRADAGGSQGLWNFRIRLFHEQSRNDFKFVNTANGLFNEMRQQNADYHKQGLLVQNAFRPGIGQLLSLQVWIQKSKRNLPPIMSYDGMGRTEFQNDWQSRVSAKWQGLKGRFSWRWSSGLSHERLDYFLAHETGLGPLVNYNTNSLSTSLYNRGQLSYIVTDRLELSLTAHSDWHQVDIGELISDTGYQADRNESGIQVKALYKWSDRWQAFALLTQDWIDGQRALLLPTAGITHSVNPDLEIALQLGRNYHAPSLNDLFWVPGGNPDLIPEEGYQGDLGLKKTFQPDSLNRIELSLNTFANLIENWILWRPGDFRYWTPENLGTVFSRGFELGGRSTHQFHRMKISLDGYYTLTRTNQVDPTVGQQLIYIPVHKSTIQAQAELGGWSLSWQSVYISERETSTDSAVSFHHLPPYQLHHLSFGKSFAIKHLKWSARLQVRNLFNTDYQTILWRAMPGRHFAISLTLGV